MHTRIGWGTVALLLIAILVCRAAPPPNDNFADRIVLSGNDVVFTGSLAGATTEKDDRVGTIETWGNCGPLPRTVWWSWTAPQTSAVILESLDETADFNTCMTVWPPPNPQLGFPVITNFSVGGIQALLSLELGLARTYAIFLATNGSTYYFQLAGYPAATNFFRFRLTASTTPVIKEQPLSLTVLSNASALFKVQAVGVAYLNYQWEFNGQDIPGAQAVVLGLTNVTAVQAGDYSARVSNSSGAVTSTVARLWVITNDLPPLLSTRRSDMTNAFWLDVSGVSGRSYRIESSTDLVHWISEKNFDSGSIPDFQGRPILTSVIFNTGTVSSLHMPAIASRKYFRASPYVPSNEICNMNLKLIRFGKDLWAWEHSRFSTDTPADVDLYGANGSLHLPYPRCPEGGIYNVDVIGRAPSCSIPAHMLEEPR